MVGARHSFYTHCDQLPIVFRAIAGGRELKVGKASLGSGREQTHSLERAYLAIIPQQLQLLFTEKTSMIFCNFLFPRPTPAVRLFGWTILISWRALSEPSELARPSNFILRLFCTAEQDVNDFAHSCRNKRGSAA